MERTRHLLQSSVIVIALLALGKITGLLRARAVGNSFGTSTDFDAFTAANQLPEVFVALISGGALAAAFIPVYSRYLTHRRAEESARLASATLTLVVATLGSISALGILFAPWVTATLLVPDFPADLQRLTAELMRIILLQTTLFGISGVLSSMLNAHQHFALPALAPVMLDVGYFVGLALFVPSMGIIGLAWGTVVGGLLHILIQTPAIARFGFRYRPQLSLHMSGVREIIRLMGPRIVTLGSVQIADLFIIRLTSGLAVGSTSGYFYGYYLMQLPETLLGTAIAIVVFPTMAEQFNRGDIAGLKHTSMSALRVIWWLTFPAAAALILLGRPAIALFLEGGAFTQASTELVYGVLVFFSLRVVSEASLEILARLFYAQHDTRTPMFVAVGWLATNVGLAYMLVEGSGLGGIAFASTIAFSLQALVLFGLNHRRLGDLEDRQLLLSAVRSLLGLAAMSVVILVIDRYSSSHIITLLMGLTSGFLTYALVTYVAGAPEIPSLIALLRSRTTSSAS